jgi:outer membrane protein assembly factor BamB
VVAKGQARAHQLHNNATPTPATDGKRTWALFGTGDVACLDADGKVVWHRNLGTEYGAYNANHGYGSSPLLFDGRLYIAWMHQGPSYILALDAATGANLWKQELMLGAREEWQDSYSSPLVARSAGRTDLVVSGAETLTGLDPANGTTVWSMGGLNVAHPYGRTIAGPAAGEGRIVTVASGFQNRGYTVAVPMGKTGKLGETDRSWTLTRYSPDCPTPVIHGGRVYLIRDDGNASCLDAATGEVKWQERLFSADVKVSPVVADGRVYFTSGRANCVVVKEGDKLEVLARNDLDETTLSTPTLANGTAYVRTEKALYAFRK